MFELRPRSTVNVGKVNNPCTRSSPFPFPPPPSSARDIWLFASCVEISVDVYIPPHVLHYRHCYPMASFTAIFRLGTSLFVNRIDSHFDNVFIKNIIAP